ncbi:nuclear transport factor 2 family protein [Streptomyces sp. NPDC008001]|uniref:nuclear transport factor 2 family protein n=1 Tax=Streptomyces sp. NPDC008001 TaxID=3364804 RepID=UPI0036E415C4
MDTDTMQRQLRHLSDRAEIIELVDRYLRSLDEGGLGEGGFGEEWGRAFFTEDAGSRTPAGEVRGRAEVVRAVASAMALFERTVHFGTNYLIDIDFTGDRATVTGNQLSTHVLRASGELFESGGRMSHELVRTGEGWRMRRADLEIVWTRGAKPVVPGPAPEPEAVLG